MRRLALTVGPDQRPAQRAGRWAACVLSASIALSAGATPSGAPAPEAAPLPVPVLHFNFPDSPEKRLVEQHCVACHDLGRIQNAGGSRSGWAKRLKRMIARGAKLPDQDVPAVSAFLAKQFPIRLRPVDADTATKATAPATP